MIKAKVNGKKVEIETSYKELSFRKYLKITQSGLVGQNVEVKRSDILSVMLDIPVETIRKAEFIGLDPVLKALSFIFDTQPQIDEYPTKVGPFIIPKDITQHSVEQFETMGKYVVKAANPDTPLIEKVKLNAMYCAIYCQPLRDKSFDEEKAQWLSETILDYPCEEVMSAGVFFTLNYRSLKGNLPMSYLYQNIPLRRKQPVLKRWLRRLGFTRLWTRLRVIWGVPIKMRFGFRSTSSIPK